MSKEKKEMSNDTNNGIFGKQNYILMGASVAMIIIGFFLMSGSEDIYSTMKITIAPLVVLIGFALGVYAIMKKPN